MHEESEEKVKTKADNANRQIEHGLLCGEENAVESWRIFKIMSEFVTGFEVLRRYELAATFFGTARCEMGDKVYQNTTDLAHKLSKSGFTIITGGGAGAMEAANKGAYEAGGKSVGLNIRLPNEQIINKYINDAEGFHYFFTRKVMLAFASEVYIFAPGGFGTLDEFFEMATLVQTKKIQGIPLILMGKEYWTPLLKWIEEELYTHSRAIDKEDMEIYHLVDSVDEAHDLIMKLTEDVQKCLKGRRMRVTD